MALQVSGLVSGLDVPTIVNQLMQSESYPQTLLNSQLTRVQSDAAAYRDINSRFAALLSAAKSLTASSFGSNVSATVTGSGTVASAGPGAATGSTISFTVDSLAAAETVLSQTAYTSATDPLTTQEPQFPLTVLDAQGNAKGTIALPANGSLTDAAAAINASGLGLRATIVQLGSQNYHLQVSAAATGQANAFTLQSSTETAATAGGAFVTTTAASDAVLSLPNSNGLRATSSTNTFGSLIQGVSIAVSAITPPGGTPTTVTVGTDNTGITKSMQALVDAANAAIDDITKNTSTATGSTAALKGDYQMQNLAQQVLSAVASSVGTAGTSGSPGSAAQAGLQLTRDGHITFDAAKFSSALTTTPDLVKQLVAGTTTTPGVATRLATLATSVTDVVTGTLVTLANGEDSTAKDLQSQIDDWALRLNARREQLTTQYTNLQSILSTLQSQQSWLGGILGSMSSSSSSKSS